MTSYQCNDLWPKYYDVIADFNWILQCTLQAFNNLPSKVLFSDSDLAIIAAVQVVYPQTRHLLCTLLKELVTAIERELDKESHYTRINDFYGSNPSVGLPSTYNTIFKELDSVLQANLLPIPLSIQRAQMNQSLLYQVNLVSINQIEDEESNDNNGILGHSHDIPQIRLRDLLNGISYNDIIEIWEVSYIASKTSKSHYVVILKDATLLCTCMFIINQGMICRHQFRVLIQSDNAIFHISHIHTRWFNLSSDLPTNSTGFITIINGTESLQDSQGLSIQDNP
ncbi:hypothetical protein RhiirB3_444785 [Rhizophagus irregularis]|nr:hypothetical protein RhiirB3_444785 [Rhizophagus irregularis]